MAAPSPASVSSSSLSSLPAPLSNPAHQSAPPAGGLAARASAWVRGAWQRRGPRAWVLWPLSLLYGVLAGLRRALYRHGVLHSAHPGIPVVVVGNVVAGGAGKTPVAMAVVAHLQARGWRPGVVSRGHGRSTRECRLVRPDSLPSEVGDEPALIARSCGVAVAVAAERMEAVRALRQHDPAIDTIVCDDGLQHWALGRDVEICVFNDEGTGNGLLLPAGPLREPWPRPVDLVVHADTGTPPPPGGAPAFAIARRLGTVAQSADGSRVDLEALRLHGEPLLAVAGIARPEAFFAMLRAAGLPLAATLALPDHYDFESWQRPSHLPYRLICTEKDALKLWRQHPEALAVPLHTELPAAFFAALDACLARTGHAPAAHPYHPTAQ